jgi:transposase
MSLLIQSKNIWVAQQSVDFRCAIDGLCAFIIEHFQTKPQEGLFIFYNRARNRLKLLVWHHNGFMLLYKRLERGKFPFRFSDTLGRIRLEEKQLQGLLLGLDWQSITEWEEVNFKAYF